MGFYWPNNADTLCSGGGVFWHNGLFWSDGVNRSYLAVIHPPYQAVFFKAGCHEEKTCLKRATVIAGDFHQAQVVMLRR